MIWTAEEPNRYTRAVVGGEKARGALFSKKKGDERYGVYFAL